ncbi:MAG: signal peptidase I, partial [Planctomycetes bacterium]|nr:signal peptidase I [Planctomycetota bacterium]
AGLAIHRGDRLWIDRTAFERRRPHRGEVVVLRNPHDGSQLCVKRVVGLPGETVELKHGDVWIDRRPWVKTLAQQRAVRQLVHREAERTLRWHAGAKPQAAGRLRLSGSGIGAKWRWSGTAWELDPDQETQWHWLRYVHHDGKPVTDNVSYNAGLSRRLNLVRDFALSAKLKARGGGQLALDLNDGRQTLRVTLVLPEGKVSLTANGQLLHTAVLSAESRRELARGAVLLELSNFDRHLLLAIGSRVELSHPLTDASPPLGTKRPLAVGAAGLQVTLRELTVYRDIYYSRQAVGEVYDEESSGLRLGSGEYYLLGDNSPISLDSRGWGGVSARLLLGRPLGVR